MKIQTLLFATILAAPLAFGAETDLKKLDADKDGYISLSEAGGSKELSKKFAELDLNKDGKLGADEIAPAKAKAPKGEAPATPAAEPKKM